MLHRVSKLFWVQLAYFRKINSRTEVTTVVHLELLWNGVCGFRVCFGSKLFYRRPYQNLKSTASVEKPRSITPFRVLS